MLYIVVIYKRTMGWMRPPYVSPPFEGAGFAGETFFFPFFLKTNTMSYNDIKRKGSQFQLNE